MRKALIAGIFAVSSLTSISSFAWIATEGTQIQNNVQLLAQVNEQIKTVSRISDSINNQIRDMASLPANLVSQGSSKLEILNTFRELRDVYQKGQNIANSARDLERTYREMGNIDIADALKNGNYPQLFNQWSHQNHDTVKGILEQNKLSMDWFNDRQGEVADYNRMLNTSTGTVSALQAAGKIANAQLDSLSQLGQLQMAQNNLLASQAAIQQSEKDMERADVIHRSGIDVKVDTKSKPINELMKRN
ncbi:hypothetical protein [Salmonella enterica]|uniref:hypothetical protein n=1 Tax=Salmonella enterica TaxID=28901 RepID=UPI000DEC5A45|nr:hypothetical protein [Salmonella enterica]AXD45972.1 hypothetical protein CHD70_27990 [Salmonella enterica]EBD9523546.1 hypothetical protein [Salmonella enterica]EDX0750026.1 hypothetical protein [Salmonella enterica]EDZ2074359.1 hypothetical protein [Salmonella enterica]EDZ4360306.1 hypothetical protein [Salmonella enterica]